MNSEIIKYRNKKLEEMKDPNMLNHFVQCDESRANDYAGREIFELLQNAIDAGNKVRIELTNDILTVSNSGEPFGTKNIESLMIPDNSTKTESEDMIGCKGVGFRASLNVSDDIVIQSGDIHLRFSKEFAKRKQEEYGFESMPPMMMCPEETPKTEPNEYITNIIIKIRDQEQIGRIENQIKDLGIETILFFNDRFESLETIINGEKNSFSRKRIVTKDDEATIKIWHNGTLHTLREFFEVGVLDEFERRQDRNYRLAVIYSPEQICGNRLYSYFQTDIDFPMNYWYAHGTFDLINNRNHLKKNTRNRILMERLIQLICNSATKISNQVDYTGYKILRDHDSFSNTILEDADLNDILDEVISNTPMLPTVNGEYITLNSNPVFYCRDFQRFLLDMPGNEDLLQYTNDSNLASNLNKDINNHYNFSFLANYLNGILTKMSNEDRVSCAKLMHFYYGDEPNFAIIAPNFFVDKSGKEIQNGSILIEPHESERLNLPSFINVRYINYEQLEYLKGDNYSDDYQFTFSDLAIKYGIRVANIDEILKKIDETVGEKKWLIPEYVRWLFDNRSALSKSTFGKFYIVAKDGSVRRSETAYFGRDYIDDTQLEEFYDSSKIIADPSKFLIKSKEFEDFRQFLKEKLNVADCPRKIDGTIDGLDRILKVGSTDYILKLLDSEQYYLNKNKFNCYKFRTTKWITKNGRRYAPNEIVLTSNRKYHIISKNINNDILFISQDELLSDTSLNEWVKEWLINEYLAFNTKFYKLGNDAIYQILNELPKFDINGEISEYIYKDIISENNGNAIPDETISEYIKFVNEGKVFGQDKQYHNVKDCLYLSEKYPKIITSEHTFIDIVKGESAESIYDRLHVSELSVNYELSEFRKSRSSNDDFNVDVNNFKISLLAENGERINSESQLEKLRNINIILCDRAIIKYNDKTGALDDYEYVKKDGIYYIKVPDKSFAELKRDDSFLDSMSEIFVENFRFLNSDGTARAIGRDINSRIAKVKNDFGSNAWGDAEVKLKLSPNHSEDYSNENLAKLNRLRDLYSKEYEEKLYSKLYHSTVEEKAGFVDKYHDYCSKSFDIDIIPTEKDADMLAFLHGLYPLLVEKDIVLIKDINGIRKSAYDKLCEEYHDNKDLLDQLLEDNCFESLLRFNELQPIRDKMDSELEYLKNSQAGHDEEDVGQNYIDDNGSTDGSTIENSPTQEKDDSTAESSINKPSRTGQSYQSIHLLKKKPQNHRVQIIDYGKVEAKRQSAYIPSSSHSNRRLLSTFARKEKEGRAKEAEKIVLNELEKLGYSNIEWVSAYARDEGINPNGADGHGYDIKCKKDGELRYIEVKSSMSSSGIEFEMTENELKFCSDNKEYYDIAYVYAMNTENPKMTIIENFFDKINDSNKTPTSYRITLR